MNISETLYVTI